VARLLARRGETHRHVVASFHADVLADAGDTAPGLRLLLLSSDPDRGVLLLARRLDAAILGVDARALTPEVVARTRAAGLVVWAWTVDDPVRARELLDAGVTGIISNQPRRLRSSALPGS